CGSSIRSIANCTNLRCSSAAVRHDNHYRFALPQHCAESVSTQIQETTDVSSYSLWRIRCNGCCSCYLRKRRIVCGSRRNGSVCSGSGKHEESHLSHLYFPCDFVQLRSAIQHAT